MNVRRVVSSFAVTTVSIAFAVASGSTAVAVGSTAAAAVRTPARTAQATAGSYVALSPTRVLDTRIGLGAPRAAVAARGTLAVGLAGVAGMPSTGVSAVVANLAVTAPGAGGYVTVYPAGQARPTTSNVNFAAGESRSHLAVLVMGTGGQVELYNGSSGTSQLILDVTGFYTSGTPTAAGAFAPLPPTRVLDTRLGTGGPLAASATEPIALAGQWGIPAASAVVLNITVTDEPTSGYISLGSALSDSRTAILNYNGRSISNLVIAPLEPDGSVGLFNASGGSAQVIVDAVGYFLPGMANAPGLLGTVAPNRISDSQDILPGATFSFAATGLGGVPARGVSAVVLNLTVVPGTVGGYLTAYAAGTSRPSTSTVNFDSDLVATANLAVVPVGSDGEITVYNGSRNSIDVLADIAGYVGPVPGSLSWSAPTSVDPPTGGLTAIACPSVTSCVATDRTGHVLRYDGATWTTPQAIPFVHSLNTISCPSVTFCMATGQDGYITFDGTAWSSVHPSVFFGLVSCASASFCAAAVGDGVEFYNGNAWGNAHVLPGTEGIQTVSCPTTTFCVAGTGSDVWTYRSGVWSAPTELDPMITDDDILDVSCPSPTFCAAVNDSAQAATFNGSTWSALQRVDGPLGSLSCVSASFCMAGDFSGGAVLYDGTTWTSVRPSSGSSASIACASASFWASASGDDPGSVALFTGGSWQPAISVDQASRPAGSVSCSSRSFCVRLDAPARAFVYNGTSWAGPADIDGDNTNVGAQTSVSCVSRAFCMATIDAQAVVFHGTRWSAPTALGLSARSVSCASTSFCVAIGASSAVVYNGHSWTAPAAFSLQSAVAVSCTGPTFCTAVGGADGAAEVYNGSTWGTVVDVTPTGDTLVSVSCISRSFCAAVSGAGSAYTFKPTGWTHTNIDQPAGAFSAVSCASTKLCVAASVSSVGDGTVEIWDGSGWTTPIDVDSDRALTGVACAPGPFCAAVDLSGVVLTGS